MSIKDTRLLINKTFDDQYIKFFFETEVLSIDCDRKSRRVKASWYYDARVDRAYTFAAGNTYISALGVIASVDEGFTVTDGKKELCSCVLEELSVDEYPGDFAVNVHFGHTCAELGISEEQDYELLQNLGQFITGINTEITVIDQFLGEKLQLDMLDIPDGYEAFADFYIEGVALETLEFDRQSRSFDTKLSWAERFANNTYAIGDAVMYVMYNGVRLRDSEIFDIVYNLREGDGAPDTALDIEALSDNEAVRDFGRLVKTKSRVCLNARGCAAKYGANITERYITLDGKRYNEESYTTEILTEAGIHNCSVTVVDSRGFRSTLNKSFEVLDYAQPTFSGTVYRSDMLGNEDKGGAYVFVNIIPDDIFEYGGVNKSSLSYTLRKRTGGGEEGEEEALSDSGDAVIMDMALESDANYDMKIICRDEFGGVTVKTVKLDCDRVEFNVAKNAVAIGKYATREELFDCAWSARINGDVTFTDANDRFVSLRELAAGVLRFKYAAPATEQELEEALAADSDGLSIAFIKLTAELAGVQAGEHVYLIYKSGEEHSRIKLFCEG